MLDDAPMKVRVEAVPNSVPGVPADLKVIKEKPGTVTFLDRAKAYYHTIITVIAALVIFLNEITPISRALNEQQQHYFSVTVIFLTALLNFLKSNELWFNK